MRGGKRGKRRRRDGSKERERGWGEIERETIERETERESHSLLLIGTKIPAMLCSGIVTISNMWRIVLN